MIASSTLVCCTSPLEFVLPDQRSTRHSHRGSCASRSGRMGPHRRAASILRQRCRLTRGIRNYVIREHMKDFHHNFRSVVYYCIAKQKVQCACSIKEVTGSPPKEHVKQCMALSRTGLLRKSTYVRCMDRTNKGHYPLPDASCSSLHHHRSGK